MVRSVVGSILHIGPNKLFLSPASAGVPKAMASAIVSVGLCI